VINFQLLGGVWILQTLLPVFLGLYTNWFNRWALLLGWLAGMAVDTLMEFSAIIRGTAATLVNVYPISLGSSSVLIFSGFAALILNVVLAIIFTPIFQLIGARRGVDQTKASDYEEEYAPVEVAEHGQEALG
jgi:solute:Na+ symporter, SSS family